MTTRTLAQRGLTGSVCLYVATLPFSVSAATAGWVLLALCLITILRAQRRAPDFHVDGVEWLLLAYLGIGLLSAAFGVDFQRSLDRLQSDANMVWVAFLFASAFALTPVPQALYALAAGLGAAALYGIWQTLYRLATEGTVTMARGTVHHITYGEMMAFAATGGIAAWLHTPKAARGRRALIAAFTLAAVAALVMSQARGPWLGFAVSVGTLALLRREIRRALAVAVLSAGVVFLAAPRLAAPFQQRFLSIFDPQQGANAIRLTLWQVAIRVFEDHPILGSGPGTFGKLLKIHHPEPLSPGVQFSQAHNVYLHQLAERGLVGFIILLALLGALWWRAVVRYRSRPDFRSLWLLAVLNGFWVMNLTENSFQKATIWMFIMFLWMWTIRQGPGKEEWLA